jgi:hypothetical protein
MGAEAILVSMFCSIQLRLAKRCDFVVTWVSTEAASQMGVGSAVLMI